MRKLSLPCAKTGMCPLKTLCGKRSQVQHSWDGMGTNGDGEVISLTLAGGVVLTTNVLKPDSPSSCSLASSLLRG